MKKVFSTCLALLMAVVCVLVICPVQASANVRTKTRTINIVFDDSGSMAYDGVTSWSQAKYAMEVFSAMMSETDTLHIYPMSSYSYKPGGGKSDSWGKSLTISGSDSADNRVKQIEEMNGDNGIYRNTPIQSVTTAGEELVSDAANEKWLVVLTDGTFDQGTDGSTIDAGETRQTILNYAGRENIHVAYVAIGSDAMSLKDVGNHENFYAFDADADSILDTVTKVATTIFNYQSIPVSGKGSYSFSADIPISKVIIFAQGKNVKIDPLKNKKETVADDPVSVGVQVSSDTKYFPQNKNCNVQFADGLNGQIVTYAASDDASPFAAGKYQFDCNVSNLEVFFEPGVDIQPILEDAAGQKVNLSEDEVSSIEAGSKVVHVRMVNPLTGKTVKPSDSSLLKGAKLTVTITDTEGNSAVYNDGDTVVIPQGQTEIYAKASFQGDIEKNSAIKTLEVTPATLGIHFLEEKGYTYDLATLKPTEDMLFELVLEDGNEFTQEELAGATFEVSGPEGIEWKVEPTEQPGQYRLIPSSDADRIAEIGTSEKQKVSVEAVLTGGGVQKKGSGVTTITGKAESALQVVLTTQLPEEKVRGTQNKAYMFDSQIRGVQKDAPYITVKAEVVNADGSTRALSEEEWNAGVKGFSFSSEAKNRNFLWKLIEVVCRQNLDFAVEKGEEVSTYRLYLSGVSASGVRPLDSELNTSLRITLKNGLTEQGEAQDVVSVKPQSMLSYLGRTLIYLAILIVLLIFIIMELRKKRFDRAMCPNTTAILTKAGVSIRAPLPPQISKRKIKYKIMPPWKPEERDITMKYDGYLDRHITFRCRATGAGSFEILNPKKFQPVKENIRFDGHKYETMLKQPVELNINSDLVVYVKKGNTSGKLMMTFRKPEK